MRFQFLKHEKVEKNSKKGRKKDENKHPVYPSGNIHKTKKKMARHFIGTPSFFIQTLTYAAPTAIL